MLKSSYLITGSGGGEPIVAVDEAELSQSERRVKCGGESGGEREWERMGIVTVGDQS